jgi:hypothetical protein
MGRQHERRRRSIRAVKPDERTVGGMKKNVLLPSFHDILREVW